MKLSANRVEELFAECVSDKGTEVEGIMSTCTLDAADHEGEIKTMLSELPNEFRSDGGGGWSFLNACNTKDGELWTGMQPTMDKLFMLGMAIGAAKWQLPRDMWEALPGGMPYVVIDV